MVLEVIYVTRHGFRSNWLVDPSTGNYNSFLRTPTGIAADPALTAHGVDQAKELGAHLATVDPPIERVYSSPYYRCLQTVEPFVRQAAATGHGGSGPNSGHSSASVDSARGVDPGNTNTGLSSGSSGVDGTQALLVRCETGLAEWYGSAPFDHPTSAEPAVLGKLFPALLDEHYAPEVVPPRKGESADELHDRVARAMEAVIAQCDRDGIKAVLLCSHAATIIALGRALTGRMPQDLSEEDFGAFTCGLSVFKRRKGTVTGEIASRSEPKAAGDHLQLPEWRGGRGVGGGWDCVLNSDCSFLSQGEERGWRFSGDESFADTSNPDAGVALGVVVEGRPRERSKEDGGSRL